MPLLSHRKDKRMNFSADQIVSISEANQNFSKTARLADKLGEVFIFKNNKPKYRLVVIDDNGDEKAAVVNEINEKKVARLLRVLNKYRKTIEELIRAAEK